MAGGGACSRDPVQGFLQFVRQSSARGTGNAAGAQTALSPCRDPNTFCCLSYHFGPRERMLKSWSGCVLCQDQRWMHHGVPRAEKQKPPPVHHHHHYAPTTQLPAASTAGAPAGYAMWPPVVAATAFPHAASFLPTVSHLTEASTSHPSYP